MALGAAALAGLKWIGAAIAKIGAALAKVGPTASAIATKAGASAATAKTIGFVAEVTAQTAVQFAADKTIDATLGRLSPQAAGLAKAAIDGSTLYTAFSTRTSAKVASELTKRQVAKNMAKSVAKGVGGAAALAAAGYGVYKAGEYVYNEGRKSSNRKIQEFMRHNSESQNTKTRKETKPVNNSKPKKRKRGQ